MKKIHALITFFSLFLFCSPVFAGNVVLNDQTLTADQLSGPGMIMNNVPLHAQEIIVWDHSPSTNPDGPGTCSTPAQPVTTVLLLHFDYGELEASGSTNFVDCSGSTNSPHSLAANGVQGDAHMNSAAKKFGNAGFRCDGTNDYIVWDAGGWPAHDLDPRNMEFKLEMQVKTSQDVGYVVLAAKPSNGLFHFDLFNGKAAMYCGPEGGWHYATNYDVADGTWHHLMWSRGPSNTMRIFIDGRLDHSVANWDTDIFDGLTSLYIGSDNSANPDLNGDMDEFRLQIGEGVGVTQAFNPPEEPY